MKFLEPYIRMYKKDRAEITGLLAVLGILSTGAGTGMMAGFFKVQGTISILFLGTIWGLFLLAVCITATIILQVCYKKWWFWASLFTAGAIGTIIEQLGR